MSITLSKFSNPSIFLKPADFCLDPFSFAAAALNKVSMIKVDFPPPETPVTVIKFFTGKLTSILLRLFPSAPYIVNFCPLPFLRLGGIGIFFFFGKV